MLAERFKTKYVEGENGCWLWVASFGSRGYGQMGVGGRPRGAHRVAYELFVGPIPDGLVIDHLCGNKACVNPAHLEAVTHGENVRRAFAQMSPQPNCRQGHPFAPDNTLMAYDRVRACFYRRCRTCNNSTHRRRYHARKAA